MFAKIMQQATISTICVCGAGTMGSGIAQVAAQAGYATTLFDVNEAILAKSRQQITASLNKFIEKGKITVPERDETLARLQFTAGINNCKAGLIIEAIIEDKAAKAQLFNKLAAINGDDTIFATNTSSLSITEIAALTTVAAKIIGVHFFNPAPLMKLVEVIKTQYTDAALTDAIIAVVTQMGKTPVLCNDAPGFIVNRVARQYYLEALKLVETGVATIETVDAIMEASGFKMGPFKLMDLIGIDVNYAVSNIVWEALDKPERLTPSLLQKQKVDAGELGNKSGKGFYKS